jgi:hypothetical protein
VVNVQSAGSGHYVVYVRMPTNLANKWPDKPWLTPITDIGLTKQDSDQFPDYVLVDVENIPGTADLFWVFQKLNGPVWYTRLRGAITNLPAKFLRFVNITKTKQEVFPSTEPDALTATLVGSTVTQEKDTGLAIKENTILAIDANANPFEGERFAPDGTVLAVSETVAPLGTLADKGVNIATSEVEDEGWGMVKNTQTAKKRTGDTTTEVGWPTKQTKVTGSDPEVPAKYADQVTSIETRTQHELALGEIDGIPQPPQPTADQTQILHQKANDWRYEKVVSEKVISLDPDWINTDIEARPGVRITTKTRGGLTASPPPLGSGGARLVWKAGQKKIYENSDVDAVARPGLKGYTRSSFQWGSTVERTDYSASSEGEESRVIYDDEEIRVYEVTNLESIVVSGSTKDKDPQNWGTLTWLGVYSTSEDTGAERVSIVWQRGDFKVWHNQTASITVSGGTYDKDLREWGELNWTGTYATTMGDDRTRQVWRMGEKVVYLNETVSVTNVGGTSKEVSPRQWGSEIWNGVYATAASTAQDARVRQVFKVKDITIFLNETPSLVVNSDTFISYREENALLSEVHTTHYSFTPITGMNTRARVAYGLGTIRVYENTLIERTSKGGRTFAGSDNVSLPPILNSILDIPFLRRDGNDSVTFIPQITPGYQGAVPCTIEESWQSDPGTSTTVQTFRPTPIQIASPIANISIGETLHGAISKTVVVGTEHPTYKFSTYSYSFPATEPATWVGLAYISRVDSVAYQDGYIIRVYRVQL